MNNELVKFDPRTKILLLVLLDMIILIGRSLPYEIAVFAFSSIIILVGGQGIKVIRYLIIFIFCLAIQWMVVDLKTNFILSLVIFISVGLRKLLPCFMLAKWLIETTEVSEFISAMWKMKWNKEIIIASSVVFRCFPTIKEEWDSIITAMKMRGIDFNIINFFKNPVRTMEYILVPLFVSVLKISDELSAAAMCRGIDSETEHTCLTKVSMRQIDYIVIVISFSWLLLAIFYSVWRK